MHIVPEYLAYWNAPIREGELPSYEPGLDVKQGLQILLMWTVGSEATMQYTM